MIDEKGLKEKIVTTNKELIAFVTLTIWTSHILPKDLYAVMVKYKTRLKIMPLDIIPLFVDDIKAVIKKHNQYQRKTQ